MARKKHTIIEYRSYFLPLNFPVLLLSGDYWKISDKPSGRLHFHNCLELGICHSYGGTMEFHDTSMAFSAGDVTFIPRNIPHTTYSLPGTESHWSYLFLDPANLFHNLLPDVWLHSDLSLPPSYQYTYILGNREYPDIHALLQVIIEELEEQKPGYQFSVKGLLLSLYIRLHRIQTRNFYLTANDKKSGSELPPDNALVIAPALEYIELNYMQPLPVEGLAELCHWSLTHFRRVFHAIMGISPVEYINNVRIMKACILLRSTERSILEISELVGFHSVSSFNRYFLQNMQLAPREYRKQLIQTDKRMEKQGILEYSGWLYPEKI